MRVITNDVEGVRARVEALARANLRLSYMRKAVETSATTQKQVNAFVVGREERVRSLCAETNRLLCASVSSLNPSGDVVDLVRYSGCSDEVLNSCATLRFDSDRKQPSTRTIFECYVNNDSIVEAATRATMLGLGAWHRDLRYDTTTPTSLPNASANDNVAKRLLIVGRILN